MHDFHARQHRLTNLNLGLLTAFLLLVFALIFWSVIRGPALGDRADNPRTVEEELRIRRGRILDANGVVLAETIGPPEDPSRLYPVPVIGPAVGYYSFVHGTSGVEQGYDAVLRGDSDELWQLFWQQHLHEPQTGRDIRLTLDANWQRVADAVLGAGEGALILLTLPDGAIRAMVSHPSYDPNRLDEEFEALATDPASPLLNRATQGQYQPGLALQPFFLAALNDEGLLSLQETAPAAGRLLVVRGAVHACENDPPIPATWAEALRNACPAPMRSLAELFPPADLGTILGAFGFLSPPDVPLNVATTSELLVSGEPLEEALIGQGALAVSPLQMALAWATLATGGIRPDPQLVAAEADRSGAWHSREELPAARQVVSEQAADAVLAALQQGNGALIEHAVVALAGPEGRTDAWYMGLAPAGAPRYAVVVIIENAEDSFAARQAGRALLNFVLSR